LRELSVAQQVIISLLFHPFFQFFILTILLATLKGQKLLQSYWRVTANIVLIVSSEQGNDIKQ